GTTGEGSSVAQQQAAVAELGRLAVEGAPLDRLMGLTVVSLARVLHTDSAVVLELLPSGEALRVRAAVHGGQNLASDHLEGITVPSGRKSQAGYTLAVGVPVIASDLTTEERFTSAASAHGHDVRSGVTAMIGWADRPWGVLGAHSCQVRSYSNDDAHFVESVGNVLGLAIQRAVVEDELRERSARLDLSLAAGGLGSWRWERGTNRLVFSASLEQLLGLEPGSLTGDPVDVSSMIHEGDREQVQATLQRSVGDQGDHQMTYRVVRPDGGIRWLECRGRAVREADGETTVVGVATDITDRRLVDEIKSSLLRREHQARLDSERARERLSFLAEASASLTSTLDPVVIYRHLAELVVPELCDICIVDAFDDDGLLVETALCAVRPAHGKLVHELRRRRVAAGGDGVWSVPRAVRSARSELSRDITDDLLARTAESAEHLELLRELAPRSVIVVPLIARGRVLGGLSLLATNDSRNFEEDDLALTEELASRAAMAVDNALLYESRSVVARALQATLLPPALPFLPGMDLAARYRVAEGDIEIGGDFYDVFEVGGGRWAAVIGDVCGRGPDAAALTGLMRHSVRAAAVRDDRPSHVLTQTNDAIIDQIDDTKFCTAAFVRMVLPPGPGRSAELVISCGGHPRPIVLRADGSVERVDAPGTLLGVLPNPPMVDVAVTLEAGSSLLLYTDGVTEARRAGEQFGEAGLMHLVENLQYLGADALVSYIDLAVSDYQDGESDDMAVMALRVTPV
ncbi:MAG: SpoIIE family protein phosphatase, partial [Actinomycetota bacterium]|nr:SpoIIE family protein phosphatase [Actinomycetota bacterium]